LRKGNQVREGKKKSRAQRAQVESAGRERVLFFFRCFKTYTISQEGRSRRFPPNNE
jgi:hypothetical protein